MKNAVRIHERDNVAVVIEPISKGELCIYTDMQGMEQEFAVRECILFIISLHFAKYRRENRL